MAYMNQEKKAKIREALKKVVPTDWKWSLGVRHHSSIVMTISEGPAELMVRPEGVGSGDNWEAKTFTGHRQLNDFYIDHEYTGELFDIMTKIVQALNLDNFDHSDPMSDYFHVGHYVDLQIGKWDKPFVVKGSK